ncbi:hypothetical protein [Candidatus Magnetominusculus xianensis]|uniref:Type II secretion system protein GspC N-terminal domain-containing protein n=1 Tax=Candidatus Magnetominusculus xianensis TaxID=1748249 RepID=A0ABR5SH29_9BACT|nr:hypothetical protein [Candidatus Magnetominusculus xianensis]KWT90994.1 hypothetical protein ASN18_1078 [Candidatus Magnetominusculus xianensis]MBF0403148.1 hypothetical protein [Nitrospirota bacterium]
MTLIGGKGAARAAEYVSWVKRNAKDLLIIILIAAGIPLMIVKNPEISYNARGRDMESIQNNKKKTLALILETSKRDYKEIFIKNVFTADGKYPPDPLQKGDTKKTYKLIGVLSSQQKVAVLLDNEGQYHYRREGQFLPSETLVSELTMTSVTLKNQEGEIKLKIFSVKK